MYKDIEIFLKESNAIEDVWDEKSLKQAIKAWKFIELAELTPENIKKCHGILTKHLLPKGESGDFRRCPVWIGGHEAMEWELIPHMVSNWCYLSIKGYPSKKDAEDTIKFRHKWFEKIHPFVDGNGRIGRILWQLERIRAGLKPKVIYEAKKWDYYKWFQNS